VDGAETENTRLQSLVLVHMVAAVLVVAERRRYGGQFW